MSYPWTIGVDRKTLVVDDFSLYTVYSKKPGSSAKTQYQYLFLPYAVHELLLRYQLTGVIANENIDPIYASIMSSIGLLLCKVQILRTLVIWH
jgi:hypothetical protein